MRTLRRTVRLVRDVWLAFGITLLLLVALEGVLSLVCSGRNRSEEAARAELFDRSAMAEIYPQCAWLEDYARESIESHRTEWASYVYWRRKPYRGRYINIDKDGIRKTWTPEGEHSGLNRPPTVFMFGGSAMWGSGARDDCTIPSFLARRLHERGVRCRVVNFGEAGYVSTQELILLIRQLQRGNVPDLVIFYDGFNDTYSAYQQQAAGLPQNEFNRVREFNASQPGCCRLFAAALLRGMARELSMVRLGGSLCRWAGLAVPRPGKTSRQTDDCDLAAGKEALFDGILDVYRGNLALVQTMGRQYGFKTLFYWQPTIYDKRCATPCERAERQKRADLELFFRRTCEWVRGAGLGETDGVFHDLSGIFAEVRQPVFLDWCHISEWGNDQIAERMVEDVARLLRVEYAADEPAEPGP